MMCAAAGCGGAAAPTAPEPAAVAPPSATTAAIHGTVAGASSASVFNTNSTAAGMTVTVEGTNLQATVNGAGQFVLTSVPTGTVVLRFNGLGANAQLTLTSVNGGQTITITVVVTGDRAELQEKTAGSEKEIEGRIDEKLADGLRVAGRKVIVTSSTTIRHGDAAMTMAQLEVGQRVHVRGTVSGTGASEATTATLIIVQNLNTSVPVNLEGTVSGLTGDASAFQFTLEGRTVKGGASTDFSGGDAPSFRRLANGDKVHVKGTLSEGFVTATHIILKSKADESEREAQKYEGRGTVESRSGDCPSILFSLNGVRIQTGPDTEFEHLECRTIANGVKVKVSGTKRPDGIVQAKSVHGEEEKKPEPVTYEGRGTVESRNGDCPSILFSLNGVRVQTNAETKFEGAACSSIVNGTKVKVVGTKRSDGSVQATLVKKEEEPKPEPGTIYEARGEVTRLEGTCPSLAFSFGDIRIRTNASTAFEIACSSLANGSPVKVIGKKESNGSVTATHVKKP